VVTLADVMAAGAVVLDQRLSAQQHT